jgi:hypothetical protein
MPEPEKEVGIAPFVGKPDEILDGVPKGWGNRCKAYDTLRGILRRAVTGDRWYDIYLSILQPSPNNPHP